MAPLAIGAALAAAIAAEAEGDPDGTPIAAAEVAPPGFLNLRLRDGALESTIAAILADPPAWGRVAGRTGPLGQRRVRVGQPDRARCTSGTRAGRSSATCSAASSRPAVSRSPASTTSTTRAAQIRNLGASVAALRRGEPVPDDGYHGDYVDDLAARAARRRAGWPPRLPDADTDGQLGHWAAGRIREGIEASLAGLGVRFDVWTSEARLHDEGWVARAVERLRERGHVYEQDGAIWFRSTDFGDDKDRVIFRSNGEPTYFAADIGYVTEKFSRGFDHLIYVWGADHHGTVARVRNAAEAMGYDREAVQVLLYSWVRFVRDGEEVSMSKRAGEFITLDELLAEVGVDAARWFFASRAATTGIDFDIELAKKQSSREPRLLRPVRPRPDRVDPAQGGRCRVWRRRPGSTGSLAGAPEAALARAIVRLPGGRRGRGRGRGDARRSPPTRPSWRRPSTASTATRGSSMRTSRSDRRRAWRSPRPRGSRSRTR